MKLTIAKSKTRGSIPLLTGYPPALRPSLVKWFATGEASGGLAIDKRRVIALKQHYQDAVEFDEKARAWVDKLIETIPKRLSAHVRNPDYKYQQDAILRAIEQKSLGCFIDAGGGKSVIACETATHLGPTLLIVPPAIWYDAYVGSKKDPGDLLKWYPHLKVADAISPTSKAGKMAALNQRADLYVVSMYGIGERQRGLLSVLLDIPFAQIVVDESSLARNVDSTRAQAMLALKDKSQHKLALSADPCPNHVGEIWTQAEFLRPGSLGTFGSFSNKYAEKGRHGMKFRNDDAALQVFDSIKDFAVMMPQSAFWKNRPKLELHPVGVRLGEEEMQRYRSMEAEYTVRFEHDGQSRNIEATSWMDQREKLKQITAGFTYGKGEAGRHAYWVGEKSKFNTVCRMIASAPKEQWIVWCQLKAEGELFCDELEEAGYSVAPLIRESSDDKAELQAFKRRKRQILVSHPSQASHAVRLPACNRMIFSSLTMDNDAVYQAVRRIYRPPQKRDCHIYFLIARDTCDEEMWADLKGKMEWRDKYVEKMVEAVSEKAEVA